MAKRVTLKNLTIDLADTLHKEDVEKVVYNAFEHISSEAEFVNLIKIKVSDIPADKVNYILRCVRDDLAEQGITNCVFVPIHPQGIQDISIDRLEWTNEP